MIGEIRIIYICLPVAVAAFAAYGSAQFLYLNLLLIPIFLRRRKDVLTPFLALVASFLSYFFISLQIPELIEGDKLVGLKLTWTDQVKFDGGKMKGFAKTESGEVIYALLKFEHEDQKQLFQRLHIPSYRFSLEGTFKELPTAAHDYSFSMEDYLKMNGAVGMFESDRLLGYETNSGLRTTLSKHRWNVKQHIQAEFPESLVTEAEALLIGDRSGMDEEVASDTEPSALHICLLFLAYMSDC